jgi:hypothetical protein
MVFIWITVGVVGLCVYSFIAGIFYRHAYVTWNWDKADSSIGAVVWPLALLVCWPVRQGRAFMEKHQKACELQKELDEARRKKDEQDVADALKEEYR